MKSAGKRRSNSVLRSRTGSGTAPPASTPESNHASSTGSTRRAPARSHSGHVDGDVVDVRAGAGRGRRGRGPASSASSATEPTQVSCAAVVAAPDRERRAPEAVARQRPVDVVLEPVAEAPVLDVLGVPADRLVLAQQRVLVRGGAREPRGLGPVDRAACRSASSAGTSACSRRRCTSRPAAASASMSAGSASFTNCPACAGTDVGRTAPRRSTGLSIGRPSRSATSRSISPNAGARCTMPEPSSMVTKSSATTRTRAVGRRAAGSRTGARSAARRARRPRPARRPRRRRRARGDARRGQHEVAAAVAARTRTYSTSGPTAARDVRDSVHGVVVHTRRSKSRSTTGKRT